MNTTMTAVYNLFAAVAVALTAKRAPRALYLDGAKWRLKTCWVGRPEYCEAPDVSLCYVRQGKRVDLWVTLDQALGLEANAGLVEQAIKIARSGRLLPSWEVVPSTCCGECRSNDYEARSLQGSVLITDFGGDVSADRATVRDTANNVVADFTVRF